MTPLYKFIVSGVADGGGGLAASEAPGTGHRQGTFQHPQLGCVGVVVVAVVVAVAVVAVVVVVNVVILVVVAVATRVVVVCVTWVGDTYSECMNVETTVYFTFM